MQQTPYSSRRAWKRRAMSLLLALVMILGLVPGLPGGENEASAHWADPYLSQLVEWGFIRADQANNPDLALTRADFMAIVNRAYGYHEPGETPFEDVDEKDWYFDDVGIAYTARYIKGTSPTTASPRSPLTRETAATILGRNMMLQESAGELLDFTDARRISNWARGTIKSSLEHYLISGYDDGTFRPQRNVSWGEMASMLTNIVGTPLQEPGDYTLGGTFGNVTITSPGVTLRDTVVSGDLYVTGGVGLGGVTLENVTVLGRIIASGTGQSEIGESSILLRNVTADELLVDNLQDHLVSVRADGVTEIGQTTVRTSAYIEDNTPDGLGLQHISMEAETYPEGEEPEGWEPPSLTLAGRIGEVINKTPGSIVHAAAGTVAKLTVDEAAEGSTVVIDRNTVVKELNLDTGVAVTGEGDIEKLVVNAPGSTVEMLPDEIVIRPGITAIIAGEEMDSVAAQESTMGPMILAGYPQAQDITPNGLDAAFMTNKSGTVYWAVSTITDGSVGEDDLIKPPSYGNIAVRNGSVKVSKGNEEVISKVTGLTPGGSYYLSAILVDARDQRSAVKVISFTTPDNTKPAFCTGYPKMSKVSRTDSVVAVMPTKDCKLYYALLPEGAAAPTEDELKTASVSGALGYGVRDVTKNVDDAFRVNDVILEETTTYVLYLWLTDGINSSAITPLRFTTDDDTPPEFIVPPYVKTSGASNVELGFQLSEAATVYWVAFPSGSVKRFPAPQPGSGLETAPLNSSFAINQVVNGMNIGAEGLHGSVSVKSKEPFIGSFNITKMKPETTYEVYYVAKDNAGPDRNYSVVVGHITVSTQDSKGPVFVQSFQPSADGDPRTATSSSDIRIDVSEDVIYERGDETSLLDLYKATGTGTAESRERARATLSQILYNTIVLKKANAQDREESIYRKYQASDTRDDWTIDYTQATVEARSEGGIRITFPKEGLRLKSGGKYWFHIEGLADISLNHNLIGVPDGPEVVDFHDGPNVDKQKQLGHDVWVFDVDSPKVTMGEGPTIGNAGPLVRDENGTITNEYARKDSTFYLRPDSTSAVADTTYYDVLLWSGTRMVYDLYYRVVDKNTFQPLHEGDESSGYRYPATANYLLSRAASKDSTVDQNGWIYLGESDSMSPPPGTYTGQSLSVDFNGCDDNNMGQLKNLSDDVEYQFVITIKKHGSETVYESFEGTALLKVNVAAGQPGDLYQMASPNLTTDKWERFQNRGDSIGQWRENTNDPWKPDMPIEIPFDLQKPPSFTAGDPEFVMNNDGTVSVSLNLTASGLVHWSYSEVDPETGMAKYDTTRYLMEGTDDYQKDANGDYTLIPDTNITLVPNTDNKQMYILADSHRPPTKGGTTVSRPMPDWMIGGGGSVDVAEGENQITWPDAETVISQEFGSTGSMIYGKPYEYNKEADTDSQGLLVFENLEPLKTYFVYFVITAPKDYSIRSHVYIYQFTVPELKKPQISLYPDGNTGGMNVVLDMNSRLEWRVFSAYDANDAEMISILTQPFIKYTDHHGSSYTIDDDGNVTQTGTNKLPTAYQNYTVMQALTNSYSFSDASRGDSNYRSGEYWYPMVGESYEAYEFEPGYSVFDMYANNDSKKQLIKLISNPALDDPEHLDSATAAASWSGKGPATVGDNPAKFDRPLIDNTPYVFLAWAINQKTYGDGTTAEAKAPNASFRMTEFMKGALEGPVADKAPTGYLEYNEGDNTYSGRFTVHFDKPTYLLDGGQRVNMTPENIFIGGSGEYKDNPIGGGKFTAGNITTQNVQFVFKGVGDGVIIEFLDRYFVNYNRLPALDSLNATIEEYKGKTSLVVRWSGKSDPIGVFPLSGSSSSGLSFSISGAGIDGGTGKTPTLALDSRKDGTDHSTELTAAQTSGGKVTDLKYTWTTMDSAGQTAIASDVIKVDTTSSADGSKATITGLRPGTAWIKVAASGTKDGSPISSTKDIKVTVIGELKPFAEPDPKTTGAVWDSTTGLTLTINAADSAPSATFDVKATDTSPDGNQEVTSPALSETARVVATVSGGASSYVECTVNPDSAGKIDSTLTVRTKGNPKEGYSGSATVTVNVVSANDRTVNLAGPQTFTVTVSRPATTRSNAPAKNTVLRPTLTLSKSSLKLNGTNGMSAKVTAESNVANSVQWSSDNPAVATVTNTNRAVTITGHSAGTATISATLTYNGQKITRTITVTVETGVTITGFAANKVNGKIVGQSLTENSDGSYTWERTDGSNHNATLTFTSPLSMTNADVSVESSDDSSVRLYGTGTPVFSNGGKTAKVQLEFYHTGTDKVTITVSVGKSKQAITVYLKGSDVLASAFARQRS